MAAEKSQGNMMFWEPEKVEGDDNGLHLDEVPGEESVAGTLDGRFPHLHHPGLVGVGQVRVRWGCRRHARQVDAQDASNFPFH